jgi:hypothetical protein
MSNSTTGYECIGQRDGMEAYAIGSLVHRVHMDSLNLSDEEKHIVVDGLKFKYGLQEQYLSDFALEQTPFIGPYPLDSSVKAVITKQPKRTWGQPALYEENGTNVNETVLEYLVNKSDSSAGQLAKIAMWGSKMAESTGYVPDTTRFYCGLPSRHFMMFKPKFVFGGEPIAMEAGENFDMNASRLGNLKDAIRKIKGPSF